MKCVRNIKCFNLTEQNEILNDSTHGHLVKISTIEINGHYITSIFRRKKNLSPKGAHTHRDTIIGIFKDQKTIRAIPPLIDPLPTKATT